VDVGAQRVVVPVRVVTALLRGTFVWGVRRLWKRGELARPDDRRPQGCVNLLNRLGHATKTRGHVDIRERYAHGAGVATSVARSMRGGPLKNRQVVGCDGERVTFADQDHRAPSSGGSSKRWMRLPVEACIRCMLQHVVPVKTQVVRWYGLYHGSKADA
jgi:hypothetical protein